ncbi:insecticidal delta-endotoxin Cry8Ea1 family protein [Proteus hauseri]|uniref:insecticidal delta-endotoxin Cry8Ea1 family protein n=1 Tax=Proteus hauseri TaxID=183417 RepID=UPI0032DB00F2
MPLNNLNDLKISISPSSLAVNKPLSCINYQDLKDGMLDMINNNSNTLPSIVEDFNQQDPLNAPIVIGEVVIGHIIGLIPVVGGVLSKITSALFGMINKNMKDSSLATQIIEHVSRIIDAKITNNNIEIIKLTTEGITDVYQLFSDSLNRYLEPQTHYSAQQQQDLREQVLNRFDDVITTIISQHPTILNLAQSAGLPFYCHSCALFVAAHNDILTNKKALDLKDDYFNSNLKTLRDSIDKFNTNIHNVIYQKTSLEFKDDYTKCNTFLSGIYTSGLSFYQSWVKRSFEIELSTPLTRWNSLELYGKDYNFDYQKSYYQMYIDMGKDMLQRTSMLQSIETYSHIDAVIRVKQNYLNTEKQPSYVQYEGCSGVTGDSNDVLKTEIFFQADNNKRYLSPTAFLPSVRYISNTPWGALKYMVLDDVNNQSFSIGQGNRENKSYLNIPGYCFNGINLYMSRHNGKQCHDDSGAWLTESGPIFRFYDGYGAISLEMENALPIKQRSYELDLNHGFDSPLSQAQFAYADMLVGKNCILLHQDAIFCLPSDEAIGKNSEPQRLVILLQCANESEQSLSLSIRTGNALKGTLVASGTFSLNQNQDNIIYKLTPLINHPRSNNKAYFRTYKLELDYTLTSTQESDLYIHLHFSKSDTLLADITLLF